MKEISTLDFHYEIFNLVMYFGASRTIVSLFKYNLLLLISYLNRLY